MSRTPEQARAYYEKNKEQIRKRQAEHYKKNRERILKASAEYAAKNPEVRRKATARYRKRHPEKARESFNKWRKTNVQGNIAHRLRARLWDALKNAGVAKKGRTIDWLGCSIAELMQRLEFQFKPGMSWDNRSEWHIDHIRPLSSFDLTDPEQLKQACHYTNLQPLWASENFQKGAKWDGDIANSEAS